MAWEEGVRWFVCSPAEVGFVRRALGPDAVLVTPGVRPAGGERTDDQKRVATPEQAVRDGASWVVVGRPIRDAADRLAAARAIASAIESVAVDTARADTTSERAKGDAS
jgi:orotidine-5'-phosphate decarboxylase